MSPDRRPVPLLIAHERHRRGMGSDVHLVATGDPAFLDAALDRAEARLDELEARWSRFRSDSELSRLNRVGELDGASDDLLDAVDAALEGWRATDARFDPTVHDALVQAGYDRSFDQLDHLGHLARPARTGAAGGGIEPTADDRPPTPPPGPVGIVVDREHARIELPDGVRLDLGGLGKGLAADVLVAQLMADGCEGACANVGGDVRVSGRGPAGASWVVGIEDPFLPGTELTRVGFDEGAVATSASVRRRWVGPGGEPAHHLIDPATGRPASRGLVAVTVVAGDARWAEVLTKAAFVAGPDDGLALIEAAGARGLLVTDAGAVVRSAGFEVYEPAPAAAIHLRGATATVDLAPAPCRAPASPMTRPA